MGLFEITSYIVGAAYHTTRGQEYYNPPHFFTSLASYNNLPARHIQGIFVYFPAFFSPFFGFSISIHDSSSKVPVMKLRIQMA
jgi:hypothetical protein